MRPEAEAVSRGRLRHRRLRLPNRADHDRLCRHAYPRTTSAPSATGRRRRGDGRRGVLPFRQGRGARGSEGGRHRARRSNVTPRDYPLGPHDQPQSMCPAFGALRVGLRMRRTASVLCGSACCVYGLTFTSHFYGAKRTVGYVPFNSETLVTGKLFEDIRDAVFDSPIPTATTRSSSSTFACRTASGVPLRLLPQGDRGRARSSASTCRGSACRPMRRRRMCSPARC